MDYISAKEAAELWGVHIRVVQNYCKAGRIPDARKYGVAWMLPADSVRPQDMRRRESVATNDSPTLPRRCPVMIMTTLYNTPGSADRVMKGFADNSAVQTLFEAQLSYFRGEWEKAGVLAGQLLEGCDDPNVCYGACFVLFLSAMYSGNTALWKNTYSMIARIPCRSPEDKAMKAFIIASVYSGLYDKSQFPEWFQRGSFDPLPLDCYPLARFLYLKYLLLEKGDPGISLICGPLISQCHAEGALLSEIYCRLIVSIGFHDRGLVERAVEQIDAAIALALPDRLLAPLVEERSELGVLLDERLALADANAAREMKCLHRQLLNGWTILCRNVRGIEYASTLTQREHHAAKLVAKGLSNKEIALRMGLSVNTVKRYISEAIGKTGAASRNELAMFIALTGETLP